MYTFSQSTGHLIDADGVLLATGYSGLGPDKDDPAAEGVVGQGPIPTGIWYIGEPYSDPEKGPFVMALTPDPATNALGRAGFLIHGDSIENPGSASHGCIILNKATRIVIADSGDKTLQVVP